jgi:sRNA-binding protein
MIVESALRPLKTQPPAEASAPSSPAPPKAENRGEAREGAPRTVLVLQAISERDSHPIAVINDQLVKEGDRVGAARVLHIGSDSVELVLENGQRDTVRFAPPPPPMPDASPTPSPHP